MEENIVNANDKESKEFEYFAAICENQLNTVKCRYNAVFGVQEIDRVIARPRYSGGVRDGCVLARFQTTWVMSDIRESYFCRINAAPNRYNLYLSQLFIPAKTFDRIVNTILC